MILLSWNLNHRASVRRIPAWIGQAIKLQSPDLLILTEYVVGPDHKDFLQSLADQELGHVSVTSRSGCENQLLIASKDAHERLEINIPDIHPSVPSNILKIRLKDSGITLVGFRMPAYTAADKACKRETWDMLLREAKSVVGGKAIIAGDFNTAPGDSPSKCGDCLKTLIGEGWNHARPTEGFSWSHPIHSTVREIDHAFFSPQMTPTMARFLWDFEKLSPPGTFKSVGTPDHAILACEFSP